MKCYVTQKLDLQAILLCPPFLLTFRLPGGTTNENSWSTARLRIKGARVRIYVLVDRARLAGARRINLKHQHSPVWQVHC